MRSRFARLSTLVALAALAAGALVVADTDPRPARAHDELVSSDPAAGSELDSAPGTVTLTFSAELLTVGAVVLVVDPTGADRVIGDPLFDGDTVTALLDDGLPDGRYDIRWQVVSADGHPVSGVVPFRIGSGPASEAPTPGAADDEPAPAETPAAAGPAADDAGPVLRLVGIGLIGALVALVLLAVITLIARRRPPGAPGDASP